MRWRRFTTVIFALTLVVVPAAAGCGHVKAPSAATDSHLALAEAMAYTTTMNANSADVASTYVITSGNHTLNAMSTASGPVNWSTEQGEVAEKATSRMGTYQYAFGTRLIFDGKKSYSRTSLQGEPASVLHILPELAGWNETTWTGSPSSDLSGLLPTLLFETFGSPGGAASPATLLGLLRAQASSVRDLGEEVIGGVNTTHYRALVPVSRLGTGSAAELRQADKMFGTTALSFDYWVDSANLLRQLRFAVTMRDPVSGGSASSPPAPWANAALTFSVKLQLSNYGVRVHVVPPPASQITMHTTCVIDKNGFNCSS